ncbi:hypothetical protein F5I97DRAFT_1872671 [Phlebopus sp. FC_14]|nr:hypothetical protein F5I97DRAFT_1872671 [Phlebopus sp. FC_14]
MGFQVLKQLKIRGLPTGPIKSLPSSKNKPLQLVNPFVPQRNPKTGRWIPPKYSLRQQADIVKKARQNGTLEYMPPSHKTFSARMAEIALAKAVPTCKLSSSVSGEKKKTKAAEKWAAQPVEWVGNYKEKVTPGADTGNRLYAGKKRMFKGHKWERELEGRMRRRKMLMRDMAKRIKIFKQYHRKRRPNPLAIAKSGAKLPF